MAAPVKVTLTNEAAYITDGDNAILRQLNDYWSYFSPVAPHTAAYRLWVRTKHARGWDGKIHLMRDGAVPAGVFRATKKAIKAELGIRFKTTKEYPKVKYQPAETPDGAASKYQYQVEAVDAMCRAIKRGGGIVLSATGTGKTKEAADFFGRVSYHCLFVVNRKTLLHQAQKEIETWLGEEVGIVGDSECVIRRITVATVQTLQRHCQKSQFKAWFNKIAIVFVDELHKLMAKSSSKLLERIRPVARFGLTATLEMRKKLVRMKAWAFAGPVIYEFPYAEARDKGVLTQGRAIQLRFPQDGMAEGDYQEEYAEEIVANKTKAAACSAIVRHLLKAGRYVVVLVQRRAHVSTVESLFSDIAHGVAAGKIGHSARERAKHKFEAGNIRLIIASSVFEEGVDIKRVDAVVDMAEFKSKNSALQKFGRGVRLHSDKTDLLYIDFGTQEGRFRKAAVSRARAFKAADIGIKVVKVTSAQAALAAVQKFCGSKNDGRRETTASKAPA